MKRNVFCLFLAVFFTAFVHAQDLSAILDADESLKVSRSPVEKAFRTPRIVNMHSAENAAPREMVLNIGHRFGKLNSGLYELFGLDQATMRLGLDYGINDWLGVGIGRSSFQKTVDGFLKARILGQAGKQNSPITVALYSSASVNTLRNVFPDGKDSFLDRMTLVNSLILSRKFNEAFSLQINPIWLRSRFLLETQSVTDDVSLGMAARFKILPRVHVNLEYIHELVDDRVNDYNPLSLGFDIETGGHVFQLFFSSTQGIFDKAYLINTNEAWYKGAVYFGFNITRVFYL
jgi:hypothetical protein